jgi:Spy/CpxP family protein refolding chaperone
MVYMLLKCKPGIDAVMKIMYFATLSMLFFMPAMCMQATDNGGQQKSKNLGISCSKQHRSCVVHMLGVSLNLSQLQLTDDQERKIKDARKFARLKLHELKQAKAEKTAQLKTILFSPAATDVQIRACAEEIRCLQASIDTINLDSLVQLRAILTPEQRSRLAALTNTAVACHRS